MFAPIILHPLDFNAAGAYKGDPRTAREILAHDKLGMALGCGTTLKAHKR